MSTKVLRTLCRSCSCMVNRPGGFLWRHTIPPLLAAGYRVVVPDQIGFGLSEKPHDRAAHTLDNYTANIYTANIVAPLNQLDRNAIQALTH